MLNDDCCLSEKLCHNVVREREGEAFCLLRINNVRVKLGVAMVNDPYSLIKGHFVHFKHVPISPPASAFLKASNPRVLLIEITKA